MLQIEHILILATVSRIVLEMDEKFYNSPVLRCSVRFLISIVIDGVIVDLARFCWMKSISACFVNVEDITRPRVDMNFIFERRTRYLTRSRDILLNTRR